MNHSLSPVEPGDVNIFAFASSDFHSFRPAVSRRRFLSPATAECERNQVACCLALVASNAVTLLKTSLRAEHDADEVANRSDHSMAEEVRQTYVGMMAALPPSRWLSFRNLSADEWAKVLRRVANHARPAYYQKTKRGPK